MIIFSWTLTPNQIMALRAVADHHRRYLMAAARKDRAAAKDNPLGPEIAHWITAVRGLIREGFITHKEVPYQKWELPAFANPAKHRQAWEITEKGKLMLQIVAIEIEETGRLMADDRANLKLLKAA